MRYSTITALALLAACVQPEEGIDDTRIRGELRADPVQVSETKDLQNGNEAGAVALDALEYGYTLLDGKIRLFDWDEENQRLGTDADEDWFVVVSASDITSTWDVMFPGAPEGTTVLVEVYNLDERSDPPASNPTLLSSEYVGPDGARIQVEMAAGTNYGLRLGGAEGGQPDQPYLLALMGAHPDEAGILVGAYPPTEEGEAPAADRRGRPVAGSNAGVFELQEDYSYVASYEMYLVRQVEPYPDDTGEDTGEPFRPEVDEDIEEAYIFAGAWSTLNQGLPAGTWYSSEPVYLDLTQDPVTDEPEEGDTGAGDDMEVDEEDEVEYIPADTVVLDEYAPLVIGMEFTEEEPNDLPESGDTYVDITDPSLAQDLGVLSGPGFVDIVHGDIPYAGEVGWYVNDVDGYLFQVPEPVILYVTMDWDDGADNDWLLLEADVGLIDYGATTAKPELSVVGGVLAEPGIDYFLVALGYAEDTPLSTYELLIEQAAQ